jgi:hypothetical protein
MEVLEEVRLQLLCCRCYLTNKCTAYQWKNFDDAALLHTVPNTTEGPEDLTEQDEYSGTGMCLSDRPWPPTNTYDVNLAVLNRFAWSYNAHAMSDSMNMTRWTSNEHVSK